MQNPKTVQGKLLRKKNPLKNIQRFGRRVTVLAKRTMAIPVRLHVPRYVLLRYFGFHWREKFYPRFAAFSVASQSYEVEH